jgi:hypothetical protein
MFRGEFNSILSEVNTLEFISLYTTSRIVAGKGVVERLTRFLAKSGGAAINNKVYTYSSAHFAG